MKVTSFTNEPFRFVISESNLKNMFYSQLDVRQLDFDIPEKRIKNID
jgi:hypothetical protein